MTTQRPTAEALEREARAATAMRANLKRRKQQQQARSQKVRAEAIMTDKED